MRIKLVVIGLLALVVIATGTLSVSWYNRADAVKKDVENILASFNTENSKVTYESVTTSGFPFSMNVSISKPSFNGRIDKLVEKFQLEKLLKIAEMPQWDQEYSIDGSIDLGVNAISNKFTVSIHGNSSGKGTLAGKYLAIDNISAGNGSSCELELRNTGGVFGNLWNIYSLSEDTERLIKEFVSLDCSTSGGKTINSDTKETLLSNAGGRLYLFHTKDGAASNIRFYTQLVDAEVSNAYNEIYVSYMTILFPNQKLVLPSAYGKQNIEIDLSYAGSLDWQNPDSIKLPLELKINKFLFFNSAYQVDSSLNIANKVSDKQRDVKFAYKTEFKGTDLLRILLKEHMLTIVDSLSKTGPQQTKDKITGLGKEYIESLVSSVIPDFNTLGKMSIGIDLDYSGSASAIDGQIELRSVEFSTANYNLTAQGSLKNGSGTAIPTGNLTLSCKNCYGLIDDSVSYFDRFKSVFDFVTNANTKPIRISAESVEAVKGFLVELNAASGSTDKNNFKFDILNDGKEGPKINGKKFNDVLAMFKRMVIPALQRSAAQQRLSAPQAVTPQR